MRNNKGNNCMIKVSVVTVTYNAEKYISRTIESVLIQDYPQLEYIIVDGKSLDNTIKIIEKYNDLFVDKGIKFRYISEKDNGIFDAMNKSLSLLESDYVLFLNAGDYLVDGKTIKKVFMKIFDCNADIIYGNYYVYSKNKRKKIISEPTMELSKKMICTHQAIFTKICCLKERPYNTNYKMAADYDFYLEMFKKGKIFLKVDIPIVYFDIAGVSQTMAEITQNEKISIQLQQGCISKLEYDNRKKKVKFICYRKKLIQLLPDFIRFYSYDEMSKES